MHDNDNKFFKVIRRPGETRPNRNVHFTILDANSPYAKTRADALRAAENHPSFDIQTRRAPAKCPVCGTMASDYRRENPGQELLITGGNPFVCAVCGNRDTWH